MSAEGARDLVSMGLEVDSDSEAIGTLASAAVLDLVRAIDPHTGLLEILASLASAAAGAADIHAEDSDMADTVARLKRFAAHIEAARKEIR